MLYLLDIHEDLFMPNNILSVTLKLISHGKAQQKGKKKIKSDTAPGKVQQKGKKSIRYYFGQI